MKILLLDISWLAGLLEGEGCFLMRQSGGYKGSICIAIQMTDRDVIKRAAKLLGGTFYGPHGPYGVSKQVTYQTMIFGSKAAAWMMPIYSLMGQRRKAKIRELLCYWKSQPAPQKGRSPKCHPNREAYTKGMCKPCARHLRYATHGD